MKKLLTDNYFSVIMLLVNNRKEVNSMQATTIICSSELRAKANALIEQFEKLPESEQKYISGYIQGLVDAAEAKADTKTA